VCLWSPSYQYLPAIACIIVALEILGHRFCAFMETTKGDGAVEEFNLPEWETSARHRKERHIPTAAGEGFKDRARGHFNRVMPAHRKYCGLSRKVACIIVLAVSVAIVVLIVGLAAGLSHRSRYVPVVCPLTVAFANHGATAITSRFLWGRKPTQAT